MLNRRGFLATLAAVPLAALLPSTAAAPVMVCPVRRDEPLLSSCASDGDLVACASSSVRLKYLALTQGDRRYGGANLLR